MKRVVITGIGALTPIGNDVDAYKEGLQSGSSGAALITHFDASDFRTKFACELKDFNIEDFYHRKQARKMDPFSQFAMVSADQAWAMSGLEGDKIDPPRAAVVWGSGIGGFETLEYEISNEALRDGPLDTTHFLYQNSSSI